MVDGTTTHTRQHVLQADCSCRLLLLYPCAAACAATQRRIIRMLFIQLLYHTAEYFGYFCLLILFRYVCRIQQQYSVFGTQTVVPCISGGVLTFVVMYCCMIYVPMHNLVIYAQLRDSLSQEKGIHVVRTTPSIGSRQLFDPLRVLLLYIRRSNILDWSRENHALLLLLSIAIL